MSQPAHLHPSDLHGLSRLALDGVIGTTRLVEHLHHTIARVSPPIGRPAREKTRGITGLVYRSIHGVTGLVGGTADFAFGQIVLRLTPASSSSQRERFLAVLNGVLGDHLETSNNPLAIPMAFRHHGQRFGLSGEDIGNVIERPQRRLLISLHGLCMNDLRWHEGGQSMPDNLATALGYTPLYLHYNSGRHVSSNGRELAELLDQLVDEWPQPVDEVVLLGHSMGGLVARSACHYGLVENRDWLGRVSTLILHLDDAFGQDWYQDERSFDKLFAKTTAMSQECGISWLGIRHAEKLGSLASALGYFDVAGLCRLHEVITAHDSRKRGHASSLIREVARRAAVRGTTAIGLAADPDDEAIQLYRRLGFNSVGGCEFLMRY